MDPLLQTVLVVGAATRQAQVRADIADLAGCAPAVVLSTAELAIAAVADAPERTLDILFTRALFALPGLVVADAAQGAAAVAAWLEYLCAELLELAGHKATDAAASSASGDAQTNC